MKRSALYVCIVLFVPIFCLAQTGASCATPIPIPMDGVQRSYTISSSTGSNLVCTSSGTTPITYFSITANNSAEEMLLRIAGPGSQPVEVAFYDGTSCTNGNLESVSSICFYDGTGIWAPAQNFVITPNKVYIIRIKTATTGTITISGQYYTPPNNNCAGATQLSDELTIDNNAAHKAATGITPASVCAPELDNTAFYTYTVAVTGSTGITVESMNCDNNYGSNLNSLGFQLGMFTGTCSSLNNLICYTGFNGNGQFYAPNLAAGTQVFIAIDGILGSNCEYSLRAINSMVLAVELKQFTAWKTTHENILDWTCIKEDKNTVYELERSPDGKVFTSITKMNATTSNSLEKSYEFIDHDPPSYCLYRLKIIDDSKKPRYSKVIRVDRHSDGTPQVIFNSLVSTQLNLQVKDLKTDNLLITIIDRAGRTIFRRTVNSSNLSGSAININTAGFSSGLYYLVLSAENFKQSYSFIRN